MRFRGRRIELLTLALCMMPLGAAAAGEPSPLERGVEAMRKGQHAQAAQLFTTELKAAGRPAEVRARAFYLRAKANVALERPALAQSDLNIALWLNKLSPADAADAESLQRSLNGKSAPAESAAATPADAIQTQGPRDATPATWSTASVARSQASEADRGEPAAGDQRKAAAKREQVRSPGEIVTGGLATTQEAMPASRSATSASWNSRVSAAQGSQDWGPMKPRANSDETGIEDQRTNSGATSESASSIFSFPALGKLFGAGASQKHGENTEAKATPQIEQ